MKGAECEGKDLVDAEFVYYKMAAWGAIFNKILMKEENGLPVLNDQEAIGMERLYKDTLKEMELLIYGKYFWSEPEKKESAKTEQQLERTVNNGCKIP